MSKNSKSQTKRKHYKIAQNKKDYEHEILKLAAEDSEDNEAIIKYFRKKIFFYEFAIGCRS